jgi:hypothetical protein
LSVEAIDASKWLPDRGVTISIGVTQATRKDDLSAILRRADEALFEAKGSGRNCVRSSPTASSNPSEARGIASSDVHTQPESSAERLGPAQIVV